MGGRASQNHHYFIFLYLKIVRVIAAVYWGFHSKLITLLLPTFQYQAGAESIHRVTT
jgi:hypothetical protein